MPSKSLCFPILWKFPLAFKFPRGSQSLCQIPRLGNLLWCLELLKQCKNFCGIIFLQFMGFLFSGSIVGLMVTSSKKTYDPYCFSQVCWSQSACAGGRLLLIHASAGEIQTLKVRFDSVSVRSLGPGVHKVLFEPSEHLWWVWSLILNVILPLLPLVSFLVGSNFLLWIVVQQWVAVLEFLQEKMSTHPSTLPS